jgi:hypothetical protein
MTVRRGHEPVDVAQGDLIRQHAAHERLRAHNPASALKVNPRALPDVPGYKYRSTGTRDGRTSVIPLSPISQFFNSRRNNRVQLGCLCRFRSHRTTRHKA